VEVEKKETTVEGLSGKNFIALIKLSSRYLFIKLTPEKKKKQVKTKLKSTCSSPHTVHTPSAITPEKKQNLYILYLHWGRGGGPVEDEIHEQWRRKLRNIIVAYISLFPDFMCLSIANAQRIKSYYALHVYYFVYCYTFLLVLKFC